MFLEFHGYIIDPKRRYLNLAQCTSTIPGWKRFGEWEECEEGIRCYAGWMAMFAANYHYQLAQYGGLVLASYDGGRREIIWNSPPPQNSCTLL